MKSLFPRSIYLALLLTGMSWANETDAEILKDLDFYMNMDVVREEAVLDDTPMAEEIAKDPETSS